MKNRIFLYFLLIGITVFPTVSVFAQDVATTTPSVVDPQSIIKQLQAQIQLLQTQIVELKAKLEVSQKEAAATREELKTTKEEVTAINEELKLTRILKKGERGDEVRALQEFLSQFPEIYPEKLVTGFFGSLTEAAVKRFQEKHEVVYSGTPETTGYGQIGPRTVARINELITQGAGASGVVPPGLLTAPGIQEKLATTTEETPTTTPSGAIPAIPAEPKGLTGITTVPAIPATPPETATTTAATTTPPTEPIPAPPPAPTPTPTPTPILSPMPPPVPGGFPPTRSYPLYGAINNGDAKWRSFSVTLYPDPDGDTVKGIFDWGDGTTSEGTAEGKSESDLKLITPASGGTYVSAGHSWSTIGIYNIKVKAVDSTGLSSDWSPTESITVGIQPDQPVLTATVSGSNVILNWTESSNDVTGFKLYDLPSSGGWRLPDVGGSVRTYTDSGRAAGTYTYYVQAYNLSGGGTVPIYSSISNVVTVTVVDTVSGDLRTKNLAAVASSLELLKVMLEKLLSLVR